MLRNLVKGFNFEKKRLMFSSSFISFMFLFETIVYFYLAHHMMICYGKIDHFSIWLSLHRQYAANALNFSRAMSLSKIVAQGVRNPFSAPDKQHMLYSAQNWYWCNISSTSFFFFFCSFENHSCHILKKAKFNWIYWSLWAECPHNYEAKKPLSSPRVNVEENFILTHWLKPLPRSVNN